VLAARAVRKALRARGLFMEGLHWRKLVNPAEAVDGELGDVQMPLDLLRRGFLKRLHLFEHRVDA
jgi:hypothetical protein